MGLDIGFDAQTPSLPQGGASIGGLGETFTPDLSTGTGSYAIHLDLPNGPNDSAPRLALRYDAGSGNGPFGLGFVLSLPRLIRSTARGFPRFDTSDRLMLEGVGELLRTGPATYRPQVDAGAWRAEASGDGFVLTTRAGLRHVVGTSPAARIDRRVGPGGPETWAWHLERIDDALGNTVSFTWRRDGLQLYLERMSYGAYEVRFAYENRPDLLRWGRAGFTLITSLRCSDIELRLTAPSPQPLIRRWHLAYSQDPANGASLLTAVQLSGFDEAGPRLDAPPLTLSYSSLQPPVFTRFGQEAGEQPGPLGATDRRVELIDWNGTGLPGLLEVSVGGRARVWPNTGHTTWGRPRTVGSLPMFATSTVPVGVADMDGDGIADFARLDRLIDGYTPHVAGGAFGRPVRWRQAPSARADAPGTRLVDLDGDGILDLLSSSERYLSLQYRADPDGWDPRPQVVPRGDGPDLDLSDPHVFLADMTGDGTADLVRWNGAGITYWPYLGLGRWDAPVTLAHPPTLPFDVDPRRLFVSDVDGDGCADFIYLDQNAVRFWINQAGTQCSPEHTVPYVPTGRIQQARIADMTGSGTPGILWSNVGVFERGTVYFYLDFGGAGRPGLLRRIDDGVGLVTEVDYGTSAQHWARDAAADGAWPTSLPVVVPVVDQVRVTDRVTGRSSTTQYRYHDGRYDGVLREFAGFGRVDQDDLADEVSPTRRITTWFNIGLDPAHPAEPQDLDTRQRWRAIRGRLSRQETYGLDGSASASLPYERLEQDWSVLAEPSPGGTVYVPRQVSSVRTTLDRSATPARINTTRSLQWDAAGNVTESLDTAEMPSNPSATRTLRTLTTYATDPTGRFPSLAWRIQQRDGAGTIVSDTITEYDHAPEGSVGAQGLVTRRSALALRDDLVTTVYGASAPDFGALGYHRHAGESGWWVDLAKYERFDDAQGLHGVITGPRGAKTSFAFDASKSFPVRITDPMGNTTTAEVDLRAAQISRVTDASGGVHAAVFDALGRTLSLIEPGDSAALPTTAYSYATATRPMVRNTASRAQSGSAESIQRREFLDGAGRVLRLTIRDEQGEITQTDQVLSGRGFLAGAYLEQRVGSTYAVPPVGSPHTSFAYDALGRPLRIAHPDGAERTLVYGSGFVDEADEEDTRTGPGATHTGTFTRRVLDATGRLRSIQERLAGRTIVSTYEYDVKGNLVAHTDALGRTVRTVYDCLGQVLAVQRPEQQTIAVLDAAGNVVEARSAGADRVFRTFDLANRPTAVAVGSAAAPPIIRYTYHDDGAPAPADAGAHTSGGRLVRVDDQAGSTILDYDARGRPAVKRWRAAGGGPEYRLDFTYRPDGQLSSVTYPLDSGSRRTVTYAYNARGLASQVPSVITSTEYDLAGRKTAVQYANGVHETFAYDAPTGRLASTEVSGPAGVLRSTAFELDRMGNLLRITSPRADLGASYVYDDLYRLVEATYATGEHWTYTYDDAGNLTSKSDVGAYTYGEGGASPTCLTSAGTDHFGYNARGELTSAPWGAMTFDALGRLVRIQEVAGPKALDFAYNYAGARVVARSSGAGAPPLDLLTPDPMFSIESGALVAWVGGNVRVRGGQLSVLHTDHLGSVVLVTDASGAVVEERRYDPYGAVLKRTPAGAGTPVGFAGGVPDEWTSLVYFRTRYYHPRIGRFLSPDTIVQDIYDPIAWASYTYCRGNPTSFIDPAGRDFWRVFLTVLAVAALVALTIVTWGAATPVAVAVIIGVIAGGVVGGVAAARAHGDAGDIISGILVGAAVGGWAAYGGALITAKIGLSGILGGAVKGFLSGAVSGLAMGLASGFGGKMGTTDFLNTLWQSALIGAITGAALGALSGALESGDITKPKESLGESYEKKGEEWTGGALDKARLEGANPGAQPSAAESQAGSLSRPGPTSISSLPGKLGGAVVQPAIPTATYWGAKLSAIFAVQVFLVDATSGTWSIARKDIIDYVRTHNVSIGPIGN